MNDPGKIRNIALVGHRGTGKTSLLEGLLYKAGVVNRLGHVVDGTTVSDYDDDEKRRQLSLSAGLAHIERKGLSYNLLDTPGDSSFLADTIASLRVVETALMVVNSVLGVEVQTERLWARADERGLARILFCNMLDRERADFTVTVERLREAFGPQVVAVEIPVGSEHEFTGVVDLFSMKAHIYEGEQATEVDIPADLTAAAEEARGKLVEAVAETDDELLEKFFAEEEITTAELEAAFAKAVAAAKLFPVAAGSATHLVGVDRLLDLLALAPAPDAVAPPRALGSDDAEVELACDVTKPAVAFVFKTMADQFSGRINVFRVFQGAVQSDANVVVGRDGHKERIGQLLKNQGKETKPVDGLCAGDIGAVAKLKDVVTGDTLAAEGARVTFPAIDFPSPLMSFAIEAKNKGDEDKVIQALRRLAEEDPMMEEHRDPQTGETIVSGMSQVHVEVICERLKRRFGVEVTPAPAARTVSRDSQDERQVAGAPQEADGRPRPVRRHLDRGAADAARRGLRVRRQDRRRRDPAQLHPRRREGRHGGHCTKASWPAIRWSTCASSSTTARITPWTHPRWPSRSPARSASRRPPRRRSPRSSSPS